MHNPDGSQKSAEQIARENRNILTELFKTIDLGDQQASVSFINNAENWGYVAPMASAGAQQGPVEERGPRLRCNIEDSLEEKLQSLAQNLVNRVREIARRDDDDGVITIEEVRAATDKLAALEDRLNARITYSQLATIIILTAVMGAFNIWG